MCCCLVGNDVSSHLVVLCHQHKHNNSYKMIGQFVGRVGLVELDICPRLVYREFT